MSARIKDRVFRLLRFEPRSTPPLRAAQVPAGERMAREEVVRLRTLLAEFARPNSAQAVARSAYWRAQFSEPVETILKRLKIQGILIEADDPRARLARDPDESDLRVLCLELGLSPVGSAEQLLDRLLSIDPSGWLLGYPGELLQCSKTAARMMIGLKEQALQIPPMTPPGADEPGPLGADAPAAPAARDPIWTLLTARAEKTARDGNLAVCRNVYLWMANHLIRRNRRSQALRALCVVCIFDLCGARNRSDLPAPSNETQSRFDAELACLDPSLVRRMHGLSQDMQLSMNELRHIFLHVGERLELPKSTAKLWSVFQLAFVGALDAVDEDRNRVLRRLLD